MKKALLKTLILSVFLAASCSVAYADRHGHNEQRYEHHEDRHDRDDRYKHHDGYKHYVDHHDRRWNDDHQRKWHDHESEWENHDREWREHQHDVEWRRVHAREWHEWFAWHRANDGYDDPKYDVILDAAHLLIDIDRMN